MTPSIGSGFSPIFYEDHIFVTLDHESAFALFALKRETGKNLESRPDWFQARVIHPHHLRNKARENLSGFQFIISWMLCGGYKKGNIVWEKGPDSLDKRSVSSPTSLAATLLPAVDQGGEAVASSLSNHLRPAWMM